MNEAFDKLNNIVSRGALNIVEDSISHVEDKKDEKQYDYENDFESRDEEEEKKYLRSYNLTARQIKLLQAKKLEEIGVTMSEIVGKAIEAYCQDQNI